PFSSILLRAPPCPTPFPYTTLFRSRIAREERRELTDVLRRLLAPERHAALHDLQEDAPQIERRVLRDAALECGGQPLPGARPQRSEEHTSELQSRVDLVCRLLLEKK